MIRLYGVKYFTEKKKKEQYHFSEFKKSYIITFQRSKRPKIIIGQKQQ